MSLLSLQSTGLLEKPSRGKPSRRCRPKKTRTDVHTDTRGTPFKVKKMAFPNKDRIVGVCEKGELARLCGLAGWTHH